MKRKTVDPYFDIFLKWKQFLTVCLEWLSKDELSKTQIWTWTGQQSWEGQITSLSEEFCQEQNLKSIFMKLVFMFIK